MSRPCGVGIAVMLTDAWLFASAFTVNTKEHKKEKITMRANEEAIRVNNYNDAKSQQTLLKESNRPSRRHLKKIYRYTQRCAEGNVSVLPYRPSQTTMYQLCTMRENLCNAALFASVIIILPRYKLF